MSFIYLASPYTHADPAVMQQRHDAAMAFTAEQLANRVWVYSPIVHCHEMALRHTLPFDFDFWQEYNFALLSKASHLWILALDGWDQSKGVTAEVDLAARLSIPTTLMQPSIQEIALCHSQE